jgi:signal transduction histidine kinase
MLGATLVFSVRTRYAEQPVLAAGIVVEGLAFATAAVVLAGAPAQRGNATLLGVAAVAFALQQTTYLPIGAAARVGALVEPSVALLVGAVVLRLPGQRLTTPARWFLRVNVPVAALVGIATAIVYPDWTGGPWDPGAAFTDIVRIRSGWQAVAAAVFIVLLALRWHSLSRVDRRILAPVLVLVSFEAAAVTTLPLGPFVTPDVARSLQVWRSWGGVLVSVSLLGSVLLLRLHVAALVRLARHLSGPVTVAGVEASLRSATLDPQLEVRYWLPEQRAYVNGDGGTVDASSLPPGRAVIPVSDDSTGDAPLALLVVDQSLEHHPDLAETMVAVSRLALANTRLEAQLRAQLVETSQARARLLRASFEERRRLERDLHDGAQQRLLAASMMLARQRSRVGQAETVAALEAACAELTQAIEELRRLAHGIYPESLSRYGLRTALEGVADSLPVHVHVSIQDQRWPEDIEGAAYFTACEALANACKHARATEVELRAADKGASLVVEVRDNGVGAASLGQPTALPGLRDRVVALGGTLDVESGLEGTCVRACFPSG